MFLVVHHGRLVSLMTTVGIGVITTSIVLMATRFAMLTRLLSLLLPWLSQGNVFRKTMIAGLGFAGVSVLLPLIEEGGSLARFAKLSRDADSRASNYSHWWHLISDQRLILGVPPEVIAAQPVAPHNAVLESLAQFGGWARCCCWHYHSAALALPRCWLAVARANAGGAGDANDRGVPSAVHRLDGPGAAKHAAWFGGRRGHRDSFKVSTSSTTAPGIRIHPARLQSCIRFDSRSAHPPVQHTTTLTLPGGVRSPIRLALCTEPSTSTGPHVGSTCEDFAD